MKNYIISTCRESIPCDPCVDSCKFKAIHKETMVTPPVIDHQLCVGCKNCVAQCPGQGLYFYQELDEEKAMITFPYEFLPLPKKNSIIKVVNIDGEVIGEAFISKVESKPSFNGTPLVTVLGFKDVILETRSLKRGE